MDTLTLLHQQLLELGATETPTRDHDLLPETLGSAIDERSNGETTNGETSKGEKGKGQRPESNRFQSKRQGANIWILDDDISLCKLLKRQLEAVGWQQLLFHKPADFEGLLGNAAPDLLVLDQMLPEKPGTQVLTSLRMAGHQFPVLMLSALGAPDDRIQGLEVGADDYLVKPFTAKELLLRIERLLLTASSPTTALESASEDYWIDGLRFRPSQTLLESDQEQINLSRGEAALLAKFCMAPGLILTREQLARGSGSIVDTSNSRSLDMRVSKLRRMLNSLSTNPGDWLESVRGRGYRLTAKVEKLTNV